MVVGLDSNIIPFQLMKYQNKLPSYKISLVVSLFMWTSRDSFWSVRKITAIDKCLKTNFKKYLDLTKQGELIWDVFLSFVSDLTSTFEKSKELKNLRNARAIVRQILKSNQKSWLILFMSKNLLRMKIRKRSKIFKTNIEWSLPMNSKNLSQIHPITKKSPNLKRIVTWKQLNQKLTLAKKNPNQPLLAKNFKTSWKMPHKWKALWMQKMWKIICTIRLLANSRKNSYRRKTIWVQLLSEKFCPIFCIEKPWKNPHRWKTIWM